MKKYSEKNIKLKSLRGRVNQLKNELLLLRKEGLELRRAGKREEFLSQIKKIKNKSKEIDELGLEIKKEREDIDEVDVLQQMGALSGETPIIFFPIKLETRFFRYSQPEGNYHGELKIRIIPDAIVADMHEPLLTEQEEAEGRNYWTAAWTEANKLKEKKLTIVGFYGEQRALKIINQLKPEHLSTEHEGDLKFKILSEPGGSGRISLNEGERQKGQAYWEAAAAMALAHQESWAKLVDSVGPNRAAWIIKQTEPRNINNFAELPVNDSNPVFPENLQKRSPNHQRLPETRLLPERWIIILYKKYEPYNSVFDRIDRFQDAEIVTSNPIPDGLALSFSLNSGFLKVAPGVDMSDHYQLPGSDLAVPKELEWQFNFEKAEEVGMAKTIKLDLERLNNGFDRILVFGIKHSMEPDDATAAIGELLEHHHYAKGWAFIPQGTPTNNTSDTKAGFPEVDTRARNSFRRERRDRFSHPQGDGAVFSKALGISHQIIYHIYGTDLQEQRNAMAMARVLWPSTVEYFLKHMMAPDFDQRDTPAIQFTEDEILKARDHFERYVRGRGPIPAIRIGDVPYGMLPVTQLQVPNPANLSYPSSFSFDIFYWRLSLLRTSILLYYINDYAPRVGLRGDSFEDLKLILSTSASSLEYYVRKILGREVTDGIITSLGDPDGVENSAIDAERVVSTGGPFGPGSGSVSISKNPIDPIKVNQVYSQFASFPAEVHSDGNRFLYNWRSQGMGTVFATLIMSPSYLAYSRLPKISKATFFDNADLFKCGLIVIKQLPATEEEETIEPLSETKTLTDSPNFWEKERGLTTNEDYIKNYIREIRKAIDLGALCSLGERMQQKPLLFILLRHSACLEYVNSCNGILLENKMIDASETHEFEMYRIEPETEKQLALWSRFKQPVAGITNGKTLEEYIFTDNLNLSNPNFRKVDNFKKSLEILEDLPTAELERLMTETIDSCAYRLDAWITSLATKRLESLRENNRNGNYIGAYGWVENIRPISPTDEHEEIIIRQDDGREVSAYILDKGGYVYAPSMQQANAAAVLQNAWLVRGKDNDKRPFAVNLSSVRVRKAHYLIDLIRQGQPIGAGLGYIFERYLHEKQGFELDKFIDDFRAKFPVVAGKLSEIEGAVDTVAARNVVDGFAMWESLRKILQNITDENQRKGKIKDFLNEIFSNHQEDRRPNGTEIDALVEALIDLETNVDALTDLLMAESVFRLVNSDYEAGSSILDAMSRGAALPEPLVTKTPRRSYSFSQRVAVLMDANNNYWNTGGNLRSRAEPSINAWMGAMLPRPDKIECQVVFDDNERVSVKVSDLEVEPIDLLYMSINAKSNLEGGELYQRIAQFAHKNKNGDPSSIRFIHYDIPNSLLADNGNLNLAVALKVCLAAYETLNLSRALRPEDLWFADEESKVKKESLIDTDELKSRAIYLLEKIDQIKGDLKNQVDLYKIDPNRMDMPKVKELLKLTSHLGISTAYPYITDDKEILVQKAEQTIAKIEQIQNMASQQDSVKIIKMAFGKQFVVIPVFRPYRIEELQNALNNELVFGEDREDRDEARDEALSMWFARVSRVSRKLDRWRKLVLYNKSLNTNQNMVEKVIQLPINARWVGAEFGNPRNGPTFSNLNGQPQFARLAIHVFLQDQNILNQGKPFRGLLLDFWEENIPNCAENPGVVFNYDSPGAEAPEAVLIAVPPRPVANWDHNIIIDSLNQTLDNAKIRAFDGEHDASVESRVENSLISEGKIKTHAYYDWEDPVPFLPMICLADNKGEDPKDNGSDTVSTDFDDCILKKP